MELVLPFISIVLVRNWFSIIHPKFTFSHSIGKLTTANVVNGVDGDKWILLAGQKRIPSKIAALEKQIQFLN